MLEEPLIGADLLRRSETSMWAISERRRVSGPRLAVRRIIDRKADSQRLTGTDEVDCCGPLGAHYKADTSVQSFVAAYAACLTSMVR